MDVTGPATGTAVGEASPGGGLPALVGEFPGAGGRAVVRLSGRWRAGEVRVVRLAAGELWVVGQCLADAGELPGAAARALRTGDVRGLTGWPGAYGCVLVRDGTVTLLEDVAGQYPFHLRRVGGRLWFGDRPALVAAASGLDARPDRAVLAARVLCPMVPELTGDRSPVAGVERVGAGRAVRVDARGGLRRWVYEPLAAEPGRSPEEAAPAVRDAVERAVRLRARRPGRLTADVSGGLDSTSLAFLALAHRPGELPGYVYHHPDGPGDDLAHAERYARLEPRLRLERTVGDADTLGFHGWEHGGLTGEPEPAVASLGRTRRRLRHVAAGGAGVHLGGEGGDALFAAPAGYLAELVGPGGLGRLRRDGWTLARARHVAPAAVLARAVRLSRTPLAAALHGLARHLERPALREPTWLDTVAWWPPPGAEAGWFTVAARRELAGLARLAAERADAAPRSPADHWTICELHASAANQRHLSDCAREFDVWPQAPFLDGDVVRATLAVPAPHRAAPPAPKPLLAAALAGAVPAEVLARRTKGDYGGEDGAGARAATAGLRTWLSSSHLADLGVVEPAAVRTALDLAALGVGSPFPALTRLLAAEAGLRGWGGVGDRVRGAATPWGPGAAGAGAPGGAR